MESKKIAVLVDAGYFCAQASETLFGHTKRRDEIEIDEKKMLLTMQELGKLAFEDREVLRVYWYDAPPQRGQMSQSQEAIGMLEGAKLRLGKLNGSGQQKLVDALLCRDIEDLSRNKAVDSILLCSGDEDLLMAVEFAQAHGVQVKLLGVGPGHASIGQEIAMASDGVRKMGKETAAEIMVLKAGVAPFVAKKGPRSKKSEAKPSKEVQEKAPPPLVLETRHVQSLGGPHEVSRHSGFVAEGQKPGGPQQEEHRQKVPHHDKNNQQQACSNGHPSQLGQAAAQNGVSGKKRRNRKNRRDRDHRLGQEALASFQEVQQAHQAHQAHQQQQVVRPREKQGVQDPEAPQHDFRIPQAALVQPLETRKPQVIMMPTEKEKNVETKLSEAVKHVEDKNPQAVEAPKRARKKESEGLAEAVSKKPATVKKDLAAKKTVETKKSDEAKKLAQKTQAKPKAP